ncbi:uncharacterized protein LOC111040046 isoform X1 [Myzus persicae]|uniref:uncharacterized protein LOC111040046 isoform X1 n=2 Tax=Myzus persicae TaxID=13164 RepID=UPI000B937061|nr:uncharacterized protein LOC111040046 isoform X1 [Myzus persicae]XP_022179431.1 uncharacterized protein LOC111040046 isoform X1 [Myzus persicae]XP_022179432.1 uncharacterized protein LOC111040046 isoform X1 [Myzus persicae]XP_022179433.1 uncharacterized protein LOC111040046 isoform X1 [Myzus persicae]XP_022179434.1 uncharacterized protein LOC111040046 isoform X1 [Myzus persicae]XP_022179435.1 uncharacterized protein LOC111040046 isoform X1 [Myzus persicae]XP_022179436.1 uncharacterized prot
MAGCVDQLSDAMGALSFNDNHWNELGLEDSIRMQLRKIENDYESIFSWDIQQLTGVNQNLMMNLIDKIREKQEMIMDKDDEFNLNRFYLQLVASYELYISKSYQESYLEIERVLKLMETCKFDESNEQYSDAYYHIAHATNAYIALTLKIDSEKLLRNIKQINSFNRAEKSAICAVKARIFMEYPPKGNDIALKFADRARILHSTEPEWIIIWLKAKGRVRRYYSQFKMPEDDEMDGAEMLCSTKPNPRHLIQASKLYMEAAFVNKLKNNQVESKKFYKISSDLTYKSVELAKDNTKQLYSCLLTCIDYPKELLSKSMMDNIITKLSNVENSRVDQVLGKYYLKHEKNYEKAKIHLSRGMAAGHFGSSLQLIKVECLLQPVDKFPLVKTLNMMYDVFPSPKRRLVILSQILIYYNYFENNPKEMMRFLKMYIDQDIDDTFKKRHLIFAHPLFQVNGFRPKQFLNVLLKEVKELVNKKNTLDWTLEEKKMIDNTLDQLNKISKLHFYDNQYNDNIKSTFHTKNEANSNRGYHNNKPYNNRKNESWRKQKVDLSGNESKSSRQHHFASKHINQDKFLEKHMDINIKPSTSQHKVIENNIKLPVKTPIEPINSLNNSDSIETKLKKFDNKFSSLGDLHVVSLENNSINKPISSRTHGRGSNRYGGYKPSWRNQPDDSQHQDNFEIFHNRGINSQQSQRYKNEYPKNQHHGNQPNT